MAEHPHHPPDEVGEQHGLAYARFRPPTAVRGGIVVLHGAGSCKESHFDFAHAAREAGFEAIAFDARGHGASGGRLDGRAIDDVVAIASLLPRPLALRGSSMGGYFALVSARVAGAGAVVAVCPASGGGLLRGLDAGRLTFTADRAALGELFSNNH
ncbi:MAG: uncharacterized protein QOI98_1645, partial [Solirubrobacteraceae bacterium]|nr:uncharacterized protein [Solirubrobacteraceae bacterium]